MQASAFIDPNGQVEMSGVSVCVPWWSFTKTVLAVALLRLCEQGTIHLDEAIDGKPYTPAQLLRHEAGLSDYGSLPSYHADVLAGRQPWSADDLLNTVEVNRLLFEPGSGWAYSNIGYLVVAQLIEKASRLSLAQALAELVFSPAELISARLALTPEDLTGVCMGDVVDYHPGWVYHGLVVGTAIDVARLLRGLLAGNFLKPGSLARMLDGRSLPQFRSGTHPDPAYGLGLMLFAATDPLAHPIGHSGGGPGSKIAVYERQRMTYAVWATQASDIDPEALVVRSLAEAAL
jgi:CubicO group peptidase (beta-lactamase class C family)